MKRATQTNKKGISIVIVNWDGLALLKLSLDSVCRAISSLREHTGEGGEIIIADNGSRDRSVDVLKDFYPEVRVHEVGYNSGFANGSNAGAKLAVYDKIFFLNNDIIVPEDLLVVLYRDFQSVDSKVFSISPQTNWWKGDKLTDEVFCSSIAFDLKGGDLSQVWSVNQGKALMSGIQKTIYGTGGALLVKKDIFNKLGGFNPIYTPAYWEDVDLCYHAWKKGYSSYISHNCHVWHKISATSSKQKGGFKDYLQYRNFLFFMWLNISDAGDRRQFFKNLKSLAKDAPHEFQKKAALETLEDYEKRLNKEYLKRKLTFKITDKKLISSIQLPKESWQSPPHFPEKLK